MMRYLALVIVGASLALVGCSTPGMDPGTPPPDNIPVSGDPSGPLDGPF